MELYEQLTQSDLNRLAELEGIIEKNMKGWLAVGRALLEIRDKHLYSTTHKSFETYVKSRFDVARATAYQYLDGTVVIENIRNCGHDIPLLPERESHVRPLCKLPPKEQPVAWLSALSRAKEKDERVCARHVEWVVRQLRGDSITEQTRTIAHTAKGFPDGFKEAFLSLIQGVRQARESRFKDLDRKKMIEMIDGLKRLLED